jgi:hypothetical protein
MAPVAAATAASALTVVNQLEIVYHAFQEQTALPPMQRSPT